MTLEMTGRNAASGVLDIVEPTAFQIYVVHRLMLPFDDVLVVDQMRRRRDGRPTREESGIADRH